MASRFHATSNQVRSITTSRYSLGSTSVRSPERLWLSMRTSKCLLLGIERTESLVHRVVVGAEHFDPVRRRAVAERELAAGANGADNLAVVAAPDRRLFEFALKAVEAGRVDSRNHLLGLFVGCTLLGYEVGAPDDRGALPGLHDFDR